MCQEVLNDDWASHPTWASEDSGFVAHRKNIFEESLHRIEEERHDYDFNIEANAKVISLLEPFAQQILVMTPAERETFSLPVALGGTSQAIYRRVLKKIYGERGQEVVHDLFKDPCAVMPIVLARLKVKDEEWRMTQVSSPNIGFLALPNVFQREWEKVWRAQTQSMYLKSLDHMGIHIKAADKKNFTPKHLIDGIKTKYEEQRRLRSARKAVPRHQFSYNFDDQEVLGDVLHVMILYVQHSSQHNTNERRRISEFFERFIPLFFDLSPELVARSIDDISRGTPDEDGEEGGPFELPNGSKSKRPNGKKNDLRRGVLDKGRNGTKGRDHKEDSASASKESTPDVDSLGDEDPEPVEDNTATEVTNERWAAIPGAIAVQGSMPLNADELELKADRQFKRDSYSLYSNTTIFVFLSIVQALYQRFEDIKNSEDDAIEEGRRVKTNKPARDIGIPEPRDEYFGLADGESYYQKSLSLIDDLIENELEDVKYQEFLRHYYLKKGWELYSVTDLLKHLCRLGATCSGPDTKEKTPDLLQQYYVDREMKDTSYNTEINLRKQAEKYIKDGELFVLRWVRISLTY
jgi:paired amphipathic helix protein Sin3a